MRNRKFDPQNKVPKENLEWLIKEIEKEFVRRFERGDAPMDLPRKGMLAVMGYHLGKTDGVKEVIRRDILKAIFKGPLPMVGSMDYMQEWGEDESNKRFNKMRNVLWNLRRNAPKTGTHEQAIDEWSADIKGLDEKKEDWL